MATSSQLNVAMRCRAHGVVYAILVQAKSDLVKLEFDTKGNAVALFLIGLSWE